MAKVGGTNRVLQLKFWPKVPKKWYQAYYGNNNNNNNNKNNNNNNNNNSKMVKVFKNRELMENEREKRKRKENLL